MGLVTNIERWDISAAIAMATEGVRANYHVGSVGGGFGAADIEIGSKLDGSKVLSAIDRMKTQAAHLADWVLFAYASPLWNSRDNKASLVSAVLNDWVLLQTDSGRTVQQKTINRVNAIIPAIAGGLALEQSNGAHVIRSGDELTYKPVYTRSYLIGLLVSHDCQVNGDKSDLFKHQQKRYYQNHWDVWQQYIDDIRTLLTQYDVAARAIFKKELENKSGAN